MRVQFLMRFKKRYHWHYDYTCDKWVLINKKTNDKFVSEHSFIIIALMLNKYFSLGQHIDYIKRKERILDKKEYLESLKKNLVK